MKITKIDKVGRAIIYKWEGCKLEAYKCPAGVWTISVGATYYEDGSKIKSGDKITQQRADELFDNLVSIYERGVDSMTTDNITQNMMNALVSFAWNVGLQALKGSTLLKKVNINMNDKSIADEFLKWNRCNGKPLAGLTARRAQEAQLYFQK